MQWSKNITFFSSSPFYPLSCSWSFNLSCPRRLASRLELGSQVGSTTDHFPSCCLIQHTEDLSTMRVEPAEVIANRGLMNWALQLDGQGFCTHYQVLGVLWIGKKDRKESVWYQCDVIFAIRWKRKKEERKEVSRFVSRRKEHGSKIL